jgi:hypothetical protein
MQERDTFPFGTEAGGLVDQPDTGGPAALERTVEVVDGEADVVNARSPLGDELADGLLGIVGLEELDERLAGGEPGDACAIGIVELDFGQAEHVAVEGEDPVERTDGDPHVGDASSTAGCVSHVSALVRRGAGAEY